MSIPPIVAGRSLLLRACSKHRVLVMTPAILVDRLVKEDVTMERISLLVFDEAHHCRKNHPYAQVMEYYRQAADVGGKLPHILGMTACPVDGGVRSCASLPPTEQ